MGLKTVDPVCKRKGGKQLENRTTTKKRVSRGRNGKPKDLPGRGDRGEKGDQLGIKRKNVTTRVIVNKGSLERG